MNPVKLGVYRLTSVHARRPRSTTRIGLLSPPRRTVLDKWWGIHAPVVVPTPQLSGGKKRRPFSPRAATLRSAKCSTHKRFAASRARVANAFAAVVGRHHR
jgi:hypothetical protein